MAATDKALFTDVLDCLSGAHQYLLQDLANERLSVQNQQKRQQYIQSLNTLIQRIQKTHPSVRPRMNTPGKMPHPLPQQQQQSGPPTFKPPPPVPQEEEEPQEMYEVPENLQDPAANYLSYQPSVPQPEEPQEEYLAMEGDEDRIPEETYEDPTQTMDTENQGLYEEAVPTSLEPSSPAVPPSNQQFEPAGYMDPLRLTPGTTDNRASVVPEDLIDDWEFAYDQSNVKAKKEKVKVSNLKDVTVKGWLEKLGGRNQKSWQKRYCVLSDVFMYFYEKESASTYNNRIPIPGFVPNPAPDLTRPKKNQFAFKLSVVNHAGTLKDYYFRARTDRECMTWIEEIRKIGEKGRVDLKRKSMTLQPQSTSPELSTPVTRTQSLGEESVPLEQDTYEALEVAEEDKTEQDEYVDVTPNDNEQEEYVDLQPTHSVIPEEEPQEDYIEAGDIQPTQPPPPVIRSKHHISTPQLPLPPPPTTAHLQSSPSAPAIRPAASQRLPPPRADPHVDTAKVYEQNKSLIEYKRVYVILWDFQTSEVDEVSLKRGDLVFVADPKVGQEWWFGELLDTYASQKLGPCGLFPSCYSSSAFELISS